MSQVNLTKLHSTNLRTEGMWKYFLRNKALYVMLIPGLLCLILFRYLPMYGLVVAFQDFRPVKGYLGSDWVGFKHFQNFFRDPFLLEDHKKYIYTGYLLNSFRLSGANYLGFIA